MFSYIILIIDEVHKMENNTTNSNSQQFNNCSQQKKVNTNQILDSMQSNYNFMYSPSNNANPQTPTPPVAETQSLFPQGLMSGILNNQSKVNTLNNDQNSQNNMPNNFSNMMPLLNMFLNKGGGGLGGLESILKSGGGGSPFAPLLNNSNPMLGQLLTLLPTLNKSKKTRPPSTTQSATDNKRIDNMIKANEFKVK
jgi:hypothetical protein